MEQTKKEHCKGRETCSIVGITDSCPDPCSYYEYWMKFPMGFYDSSDGTVIKDES